MKIAVLGAGKMAQGASYYLLNSAAVDEFVCYDNNKDNLLACEKYAGNKGRMTQLDAADFNKLVRKLDECHGVLNTLPYALLPKTTRAAIIAGKSMVDLGGNDEIFGEQRAMHELAVAAECTIAPACGLAPGIISDIAYYSKRHFHETDSIAMFCGGLPQKPRGELSHAIFFNEQGLYNEYAEMPQIITDEKIQTVHRLLPRPNQIFNQSGFKVTLEAAVTHGAFDANCRDLWADVKNVFYATLRYEGHFDKVREMIRTADREKCLAAFKQKMPMGGKDIIVLRVITQGNFSGAEAVASYEAVDFFDGRTRLSAMQRCTAFPATETLLQIVCNYPQPWPKGVVSHELFVDINQLIANLARHNIKIRNSLTASGQI